MEEGGFFIGVGELADERCEEDEGDDEEFLKEGSLGGVVVLGEGCEEDEDECVVGEGGEELSEEKAEEVFI